MGPNENGAPEEGRVSKSRCEYDRFLAQIHPFIVTGSA